MSSGQKEAQILISSWANMVTSTQEIKQVVSEARLMVVLSTKEQQEEAVAHSQGRRSIRERQSGESDICLFLKSESLYVLVLTFFI